MVEVEESFHCNSYLRFKPTLFRSYLHHSKTNLPPTHIKNCDPFVFFPRLAIDNRNGLSCFNVKFSSENEQNTITYFGCNASQKCLRISTILTIKCSSIDGFTASSIASRKVTRLYHKIFDHSMKDYTFVM